MSAVLRQAIREHVCVCVCVCVLCVCCVCVCLSVCLYYVCLHACIHQVYVCFDMYIQLHVYESMHM